MPKSRYIVAVYDCSQCYGGPEEGGWWYDAGTLVRVSSVHSSEDAAWDRCRRLNRHLDAMQEAAGRRPYTSAASDGWLMAHVYEDTAPKGFPDRRPRYE